MYQYVFLFGNLGNWPDYWDDMPANTSLHVVDIQPSSIEYQDVLKSFEKTIVTQASLGQVGHIVRAPGVPNAYNSIIKIQRIQNLVLFAQYIAKKKEMDKRNPTGHQNEMQLFHGTAPDTCLKINQQGFNRSFSGKNGKYNKSC